MSSTVAHAKRYRGTPCTRPWTKHTWSSARRTTAGAYEAPWVMDAASAGVSAPGTANGGANITLYFRNYVTGVDDHTETYFLSSNVLYPSQEVLGYSNALGVNFCLNNPRLVYGQRANQVTAVPAQPDSSGLWLGNTCVVHPLYPAISTGGPSGETIGDTYYAINAQFFQMPGTQHIYALGGHYYNGTPPGLSDSHPIAWVCRYPWTGSTWSGTADRAYLLSNTLSGAQFTLGLDIDGGGVFVKGDGVLRLFDADLALLNTWSSAPFSSGVTVPIARDGFLFLAQSNNAAPYYPYAGCALYRLNRSDYSTDFLGYLGNSQSGYFIPTVANEYATYNGFILSTTCS